jgi:hypothetical protein
MEKELTVRVEELLLLAIILMQKAQAAVIMKI